MRKIATRAPTCKLLSAAQVGAEEEMFMGLGKMVMCFPKKQKDNFTAQGHDVQVEQKCVRISRPWSEVLV